MAMGREVLEVEWGRVGWSWGKEPVRLWGKEPVRLWVGVWD